MLSVDYRNNISIYTKENGYLDIKLKCEKLEDGDKIVFHTDLIEIEVNKFEEGYAKLLLGPFEEPFDGNYCITAEMADGRTSVIAEGKFEIKEKC